MKSILAPILTLSLAGAAPARLTAQTADPRLTVADVEKVTGLQGIQMVPPMSVPGAGGGLNFASADKHMVVMVNFGPADLYRRAKAQTEMKVAGQTIPMPLFHADVPGVGDEAFDSPPGAQQYVLYVRKGTQAISLTTYVRIGRPPVLTMAQLKQLAAIVVSRM